MIVRVVHRHRVVGDVDALQQLRQHRRLAWRQCGTQRRLRCGAFRDEAGDAAFGDAIAAVVLGPVQGQVGLADPGFRAVDVGAEFGDAETGGDGAVARERHFVQPAVQAAHDFHRFRQRRERQQDAELLATVAAGHVDVADMGAQQIGEAPDHRVALGVAVQIVDLFEVIEIGQDQRRRLAGAPATRELGAYGVFPMGAVEQPGQAIVPAAQFQLVAAVVQALGDVEADMDQPHGRDPRQGQAGQEREPVQAGFPAQAVEGNAHRRARGQCQQIAEEQARTTAKHRGETGDRDQRRADGQVEGDQRQAHAGEQAVDQYVLHFCAVGIGGAAIAPARQMRPAQAEHQRGDPMLQWHLQGPHRRRHGEHRQRGGDGVQQVQPVRIDEVRCQGVRRRQPLRRRRSRGGAHGVGAAPSPDTGIDT